MYFPVFCSDSLILVEFLVSSSQRAFSVSWDLVGEDRVDGLVVLEVELEGECLCFLLGRGGKFSLESSMMICGGTFLDFGVDMFSIGIDKAADAYD